MLRLACAGLLLPAAAAAAEPSEAAWWRAYDDPALPALIDELHSGSTGIARARANLAAARAAARAGAAAQGPFVGLDASATHAEGPLVNAAGDSGNLFTARAAAGWEIDIFGRLAGDRAAERLDADAATAALADVTRAMEGEAVRAWYTAAALSEAAAAARKLVTGREEQLAIAVRRRDAGLIAADRIDDARTALGTARETATALELGRDRAARQLGFLLGRETAVEVSAPAATAQLPDIPADLPADLLLHRPDVAAARLRLSAADERLRSARKGWLPVIGLTASGGAASTSLVQLLASAAGSFGLGSLLSIPLLDSGRNKARVKGREAERALAEANYRETVLAALRDVRDRLEDYRACRGTLASAQAEAQSAAALLATARVRAANGTVARTSLVEAGILADSRSVTALTTQGRCLVASTGALQALGGET